MERFPSIEQFRHVKVAVERRTQYIGNDAAGQPMYDNTLPLPVVKFRGTVKVHGCNAATCLYKDKITYQSRERELTVEDDNYGFAKWAAQLPENVLQAIRQAYNHKEIVIYGEWSGKGIQSGVGINQVDKLFIVFAVREIGGEEAWLPLENFPVFPDERIFNVLQFGTFEVEIDFNNPSPALDKINARVLEIENECSAAKFFGVNGVGEGIVFVSTQPEWSESRFWYKVKGSKHSEAPKRLAMVDPEKVANVEAFVSKHVHEERLNQAWEKLGELGVERNEKATGQFIKWVVNDIHKEEADELVASNLTEKDVNNKISVAARLYYFNRINR